jgi:hypothetical protein
VCNEEHTLNVFIYLSNVNNTVLNTNKNIEAFHSNRHKCYQLPKVKKKRYENIKHPVSKHPLLRKWTSQYRISVVMVIECSLVTLTVINLPVHSWKDIHNLICFYELNTTLLCAVPNLKRCSWKPATQKDKFSQSTVCETVKSVQDACLAVHIMIQTSFTTQIRL